MTRLRLLSVIDQTEQNLLRRIGQGEWKDHLPSFQQLAPLLGVSVPTLGRAVKRLVSRGVLESVRPRSPYRINPRAASSFAAPPASTTPVPLAKGRLLLVLPRPLDHFYGWAASFFLELSLSMAREGWHFDITIVDPTKAAVAHRALDRLVVRHRPTHVLLATTPAGYVGWAGHANGPSVAFLGGEPEAAPGIPLIGADTTPAADFIFAKLRELGHRRVLLALGHMPPHTLARIVESHVRAFGGSREQLEASGQLYLPPSVPTNDEERSALLELLRRSRATAVLSIGLARYFHLLGAARELGLAIPRDLSIVMLSQDTIFSRLPTVPAHMAAPVELSVSEVHAWLRSRRPNRRALALRALRYWTPGDTVAEAPKDAQ